MDGTHHSSMNGDELGDELNGATLSAALNAQVVPQLSLLTTGHLAEGTAQALVAALRTGQSMTGVLLQLRVLVAGRPCTLAVHVIATPPASEANHGDDDSTAPA